MDLMIGTIDSKRLRTDLLRHIRKTKNTRSVTIQNLIYSIERANEQQLMAIAKEEKMELRKYIR